MEKPLVEVLKERRKVNLLSRTLTASENTEPSYTLNEPYTNFDFIICKIRSEEDSEAIQTVILAVGISESSSISIVGVKPEDYAVYGRVTIKNNNVIALKCNKAYGWNGIILEKVYGIKY